MVNKTTDGSGHYILPHGFCQGKSERGRESVCVCEGERESVCELTAQRFMNSIIKRQM